MAKKKFNISSTLRKNKKEEIELAPKVPLKKKEKDMEEIKEKVEEIHSEEPNPKTPKRSTPAKAKASPKKPTRSTAKKSAAPEPAAEVEKPRIVRMTIDTVVFITVIRLRTWSGSYAVGSGPHVKHHQRE